MKAFFLTTRCCILCVLGSPIMRLASGMYFDETSCLNATFRSLNAFVLSSAYAGLVYISSLRKVYSSTIDSLSFSSSKISPGVSPLFVFRLGFWMSDFSGPPEPTLDNRPTDVKLTTVGLITFFFLSRLEMKSALVAYVYACEAVSMSARSWGPGCNLPSCILSRLVTIIWHCLPRSRYTDDTFDRLMSLLNGWLSYFIFACFYSRLEAVWNSWCFDCSLLTHSIVRWLMNYFWYWFGLFLLLISAMSLRLRCLQVILASELLTEKDWPPLRLLVRLSS